MYRKIFVKVMFIGCLMIFPSCMLASTKVAAASTERATDVKIMVNKNIQPLEQIKDQTNTGLNSSQPIFNEASSKSYSSNEQSLPHTNEASSSGITLLGVGLLLGSFLLIKKNFKTKEAI